MRRGERAGKAPVVEVLGVVSQHKVVAVGVSEERRDERPERHRKVGPQARVGERRALARPCEASCRGFKIGVS